MDTRLLTHGLPPAECDHPWSEMKGSDSARTCTECNHTVYKVEGLTEQQVLSLICPKTRQENTPILYKRLDNTVSTSPGWPTRVGPIEIATKLFGVLLSGAAFTIIIGLLALVVIITFLGLLLVFAQVH